MILAIDFANIFLMIYVIVGATASGKSKLALELVKHINAEIINADAFQVYKEMDIGTAKISEKEMDNISHHLLSIVSPSDEYNVARYQKECRDVINKLIKEDKNIVIVGGTGLYIRATLFDYSFEKQQEIDMSKYEEMDNDSLYKELLKVDAESAKKIHKNNRKRVLRAIYIYLSSGQTKSSIEEKQDHKMIYDAKIFNIEVDREEVYKRINKRVDEMFDLGLVDEVKNIINKYGVNNHSLEAIGYKEVVSYLNNQISLEECKELIKKNTRNYAKRQITFFKHQFNCINIKTINDILKHI